MSYIWVDGVGSIYIPEVGDWNNSTIGGGTPAGGSPPAPNTPADPAPPYVSPPVDPLANCVKNPTLPGAVTGTVQRFEDLPESAATGALYKVTGSTDTSFASYYVIKQADGTWNETRAPAIKNAIDPFTMPHALIRKADGTFEFGPFCWKPRQVGDTKTNPAPIFVGRSIRDVFFYQNRLGFLSDENAVMSVVGDYGNFWRRTVLDSLEADVLSIAATTTDVALLDYALPFNDGIMLFSAQRQFSLANGQAGLSVTSLEINPVADYNMARGVRPVALGDRAYFATSEGGSTSIQEYTRIDGRDVKDAADITAHVPALIPPGVTQLIPLKGLDGLVTVEANSPQPNQMHTYQFFWDGDRKVISAWRRWTFGTGAVLSGAFADGQLTLLVRRQNKAYLERMDLRPGAISANQDHLLYLDRQVTLTGAYDAGTDKTTFTFPYEPDPVKLRLIRSKGSVAAESIIPGNTITVTGVTVVVEGDESAHPVTAGELYRSALRLSRQYPLDYQGRPLEAGRMQIRSMSITSANTPFYTVEIKPYGPNAILDDASKTRVYNIAAQRIGNSNFVLGAQAYASGATPFMVGANAADVTITLANDTPFASNWVGGEYEALYWNRTQ